MRRRPGGAPKAAASTVRGLRASQWEVLAQHLRSNANTVFRSQEEIPFLDLLDMIYTPTAKVLWLANHVALGAQWAVHRADFFGACIRAYVAPQKSKPLRYGASIKYAGSSHTPFLPMMRNESGAALGHDLTFTTLDSISEHMPETVRHLHERHGRHMVRCARENLVFNHAMDKLEVLFTRAECTRMIQAYFPEIISKVHTPGDATDYWRKTCYNKFSGARKTNKLPELHMVNELGPNWETYKKILLNLFIRAELARSCAPPPEAYSSGTDAFAYGAVPLEQWKVRIIFSP